MSPIFKTVKKGKWECVVGGHKRGIINCKKDEYDVKYFDDMNNRWVIKNMKELSELEFRFLSNTDVYIKPINNDSKIMVVV